MGRLTKEKSIIRSFYPKKKFNGQGVIAKGGALEIPNHSGDHSAGMVIKTPTADTDIVNKKYVDDHVVAETDPIFMSLSGAFVTTETDPVYTAWDKDHDDLSNVTANQHHIPTASGDIDHTAIQNIGTNSHAQIDAHIASGAIHFTTPIEDGSYAGQMAFWNGTQWKHTEADEIVWDNTHKRLGIHTGGTIASTLEVNGTTMLDGDVYFVNVKGGARFNDDGQDVDFRIEGNTDENLFFADASTDRVGIGTSRPAKKLDVNGDITLVSGSGDYYSNDGSQGWTGSFIVEHAMSANQTVTVKNGLITNVV